MANKYRQSKSNVGAMTHFKDGASSGDLILGVNNKEFHYFNNTGHPFTSSWTQIKRLKVIEEFFDKY